MSYQEKNVSLLEPDADYDIMKSLAYGWYIVDCGLTYVTMRLDLHQPIPPA